MDFRFLAAGTLAAALGFISGTTVFADAPRRAADPALVDAANERAAVVAAAAVPLPPAAELSEMPKLPATPEMPDVDAIRKAAQKVRVVYVYRPAATTPARQTTTKRRPTRQHEQEHEHESSDHERGDD
jgi:hypothetical protein